VTKTTEKLHNFYHFSAWTSSLKATIMKLTKHYQLPKHRLNIHAQRFDMNPSSKCLTKLDLQPLH